MESDVTTTLSELERKLKELEQELESVGRGGELDSDPAQDGWTPVPDPPQEHGSVPPPPSGATPLTASWHGTGGESAPPPPAADAPPPAFNGVPPVPVTPPAAPWPQDIAPQEHADAPAHETPPAHAAPPWPQATASQQGTAPQAAPPAYDASPVHAAPPAYAPPPPPAAGLHRQLDELLAFRDRLVQSTDDLVRELSRVLTELGATPDPAETLLSGDVTVDAAPFGDLATLAAFEQALQRIPGVANVAVRTLDAGRATIDVHLAGPIALAAALRATAPRPFTVTDVHDGRLTLAIN